MFNLSFSKWTISFSFRWENRKGFIKFLNEKAVVIMSILLTIVSIAAFVFFYTNGLGLAYNDARSHLDISRRVVEGLKPGIAQLGSVWLPLLHALMVPTIWNDFMWHSGLSGAIVSMVSFVFTGILIYLFLRELNVGLVGRLLGVFIFAANINILYLQSTAMTELLLLATMTAGVYELVLWIKRENIFYLMRSSLWIMLSTLIRYDGWFLLLFAVALISLLLFKKYGYKNQKLEGVIILFATLGGFGVALWFLWNLLIFKDPFYFVFGPYSAYAQQKLIEGAGNLVTKGDLLLSTKFYLFAMAYNSGAFITLLGFLGAALLFADKKISFGIKVIITALLAPFFFNVLALYLGHSVLYVQGLFGNAWFNVRYGVMMMPSFAIFIGFLVHRLNRLRLVIVGLLLFITSFSIINNDAVTIDDARVGASQKNVTEVSSWLHENAKDKQGFILTSAASHDAIIFSSGLPMKRFIHEGTGDYWKAAIKSPHHFARWIILRTNDPSDFTFKEINNPDSRYYDLVGKYPFADIYQLKNEYLNELVTEEIFPRQR